MSRSNFRLEISVAYTNGATLSSLFFDSSSDLRQAILNSISCHLDKYPYDSKIERLSVDVHEE